MIGLYGGIPGQWLNVMAADDDDNDNDNNNNKNNNSKVNNEDHEASPCKRSNMQQEVAEVQIARTIRMAKCILR